MKPATAYPNRLTKRARPYLRREARNHGFEGARRHAGHAAPPQLCHEAAKCGGQFAFQAQRVGAVQVLRRGKTGAFLFISIIRLFDLC